MKINLLVIEFDYHSFLLSSLCSVLEGSNFQLVIFTTPKIWSEVGDENFKNSVIPVLKSKHQRMSNFFTENAHHVENCDIVYFNTVASNYRFFANFDFNKPSILRIHNVNAYFRPWQSLNFSLTNFSYDLNHILGKKIWHQDFYYRKKFLKKVSYFMFPNEQITNYVKSQIILNQNRILEPPLEYSYINEKVVKTINTKKYIQISVIGTVEHKRRDYLALYKAIKMSISQFERPVSLSFLGKLKGSYGNRIKEIFKDLECTNFQFSYFNKFVPKEEFESYMSQTDFLLLPMKLETRYQIYREQYGMTKISGMEIDMITYQKPVIIPDGYNLPNDLDKFATHYKSVDDLSRLIIEWVNNKTFITPVANDLTKYRIKHIQSTFSKTCEAIINKAEH